MSDGPSKEEEEAERPTKTGEDGDRTHRKAAEATTFGAPVS